MTLIEAFDKYGIDTPHTFMLEYDVSEPHVDLVLSEIKKGGAVEGGLPSFRLSYTNGQWSGISDGEDLEVECDNDAKALLTIFAAENGLPSNYLK